MSEELDSTSSSAPSGKTKGILGFVLSLVSFVLGGWVIAALFAATFSVGGAALGLLLPIGAIVLSAMGMKASKAAGEKRGLAVAGLVIGICALVYLAIVVSGVAAMASFVGGAGGMDALQDLGDAMQNLQY